MFGLFKKKATPGEFGHGVVHLVADWLTGDSGRSLCMYFDDYDPSGGFSKLLERKGILLPTQKLYFGLYIHCAMQAVSSGFDEHKRREMTRGAIKGMFSRGLEGYDFETTYKSLEAGYRGQYQFDRKVERLNNLEAQLTLLPYPYAGVVNAKYLIESFVLPNMKNSKDFIGDFAGYSSTVSASIGTVRRAMDQLSKSFKF